MRKHLNIKISGQVQGVNFRVLAKEQADRLGIFGIAKNIQGGIVYIEAEGQEEDLEELISWCKTGTPWSEVEGVEAAEGPMKNFKDFTVIYDYNF